MMLAAVMLLAACKKDKDTEVKNIETKSSIEVKAITLSAASFTLDDGESKTLTATIEPAGAENTLTWTSSNTSVATVNNGKVTAVAPGTAIITATAPNGVKITYSVTVENEPAKGWVLEWADNFDIDDFIDPAVWSKIPRNVDVEFQNTMSNHDALFDVKGGNLILRGMVNPGITDRKSVV